MELHQIAWEQLAGFALQHGETVPCKLDKTRAISLYDEAIVRFSKNGFRVGSAYLNAIRSFEIAGNLQFHCRGPFRLGGWNTDSTFTIQLVDDDGDIISDMLQLGRQLLGETLAPVGFGSLNMENYLHLNPDLTPFAYGLEVFDAFMDSQSAIYSMTGFQGEYVFRRWGWDVLDSLERFVQGDMLWVTAPEHHVYYG
ncbi:hypothetical protein [Deinococcus misasensis]|uniref:hypothetical protein n=1 Tax=Deinococcus misasensis TaxID=392413 RepID=UPI0005560D5C|nr:hypothetical protein [Deinococcus misasensis]